MSLIYVNDLANARYMVNDQKIILCEWGRILSTTLKCVNNWKNYLFLVKAVHIAFSTYAIWFTSQRSHLRSKSTHFQNRKWGLRRTEVFTWDHQISKWQASRFWSKCAWFHHISQSYCKVKLLSKGKSY